MNWCTQCQTENADAARFCRRCGLPLAAAPPPATCPRGHTLQAGQTAETCPFCWNQVGRGSTVDLSFEQFIQQPSAVFRTPPAAPPAAPAVPVHNPLSLPPPVSVTGFNPVPAPLPVPPPVAPAASPFDPPGFAPPFASAPGQAPQPNPFPPGPFPPVAHPPPPPRVTAEIPEPLRAAPPAPPLPPPTPSAGAPAVPWIEPSMPPVAPPVPPAGAVREATQVFSDRSAAVERKIVALLVTYSWKPGGEVYFVREGRNFIGRQLDCEIAVPGDPRMSARHATILFRSDGSREFHLVDERSQNGTYVNGRVVETLERLENYCSIQAGDTHFRFVMIDP